MNQRPVRRLHCGTHIKDRDAISSQKRPVCTSRYERSLHLRAMGLSTNGIKRNPNSTGHFTIDLGRKPELGGVRKDVLKTVIRHKHLSSSWSAPQSSDWLTKRSTHPCPDTNHKVGYLGQSRGRR